MGAVSLDCTINIMRDVWWMVVWQTNTMATIDNSKRLELDINAMQTFLQLTLLAQSFVCGWWQAVTGMHAQTANQGTMSIHLIYFDALDHCKKWKLQKIVWIIIINKNAAFRMPTVFTYRTFV